MPIRHTLLAVVTLAAATLVASPRAEAAYTFTVTETGSSVVAAGAGSINTTGLTLGSFGSVPNGVVIPNQGILATAGAGLLYTGLTGPASFGTGDGAFASSSTGAFTYVGGSGGFIAVPTGYLSGTPLAGTATFAGATFASLGLTAGTYVYSFGAGGNADTLTVQIGPLVSVPEPTSLALLGTSLLGLAAVRRRRDAAPSKASSACSSAA